MPSFCFMAFNRPFYCFSFSSLRRFVSLQFMAVFIRNHSFFFTIRCATFEPKKKYKKFKMNMFQLLRPLNELMAFECDAGTSFSHQTEWNEKNRLFVHSLLSLFQIWFHLSFVSNETTRQYWRVNVATTMTAATAAAVTEAEIHFQSILFFYFDVKRLHKARASGKQMMTTIERTNERSMNCARVKVYWTKSYYRVDTDSDTLFAIAFDV